MTRLPDRPNTALLIVDMQNNAHAHNRDEVIAHTNQRFYCKSARRII